jgi:hypothetical protein
VCQSACAGSGQSARSRCGAHSDSAHLDLAPERNAAVPECKIRSERGIKVWCGITLIRSERGIKVVVRDHADQIGARDQGVVRDHADQIGARDQGVVRDHAGASGCRSMIKHEWYKSGFNGTHTNSVGSQHVACLPLVQYMTCVPYRTLREVRRCEVDGCLCSCWFLYQRDRST